MGEGIVGEGRAMTLLFSNTKLCDPLHTRYLHLFILRTVLFFFHLQSIQFC